MNHNLEKLEKRAIEAVFLGYTQGYNDYKLKDVEKGTVVASRDARFDERTKHGYSSGNDEQKLIEVEVLATRIDDENGVNSVPSKKSTPKKGTHSITERTILTMTETKFEYLSPSNNFETLRCNPEGDEIQERPLGKYTYQAKPTMAWWPETTFFTAVDDALTFFIDAVFCFSSEAWKNPGKSEFDPLIKQEA